MRHRWINALAALVLTFSAGIWFYRGEPFIASCLIALAAFNITIVWDAFHDR